ncbi:DUF6647 family protein [Roseovarius sp. CAU 1744]|uniref:DUF6647 family protein n=1 Tax=Roseovarius sp. CAU 1744 TaxID=3140368 RepID=UPI00325BC5F4
MFPVRRAALAVAAQFLCAFSSSAAAEPFDLSAGLLSELHQWIDTTTDLPKADTPATIVFADAQDVAGPNEMASAIGDTARGLYEPRTGTITLFRPWSADDPQDVAVLLHELVHHRQGGAHFYCEAAKEFPAYQIQKDWLAERGLSLDVNWIAVVLSSSCAARDFHP